MRYDQPAETSAQYFERQYNNRAAIADAQAYTDRAVARSKAAREALGCRAGVPYGTSPRETVDLFPGRKPGAPLLAYIHGGYWRSRHSSDFSYVAPPFVEAGLAVALPTYDLAPQVSVAHIVGQVRRALAWLHRHGREFNADPARMFVCGHSAGGHLTAMMVATDWTQHGAPADLVKGALAISGVFDLAPLVHVSFNSEMRLTPDTVKTMSPVHHRPPRAITMHTAVGANESAEFKRQAKLIGETWPECRGQYLEVPGTHHLSVVEALAEPGNPLFELALASARAC